MVKETYVIYLSNKSRHNQLILATKDIIWSLKKEEINEKQNFIKRMSVHTLPTKIRSN